MNPEDTYVSKVKGIPGGQIKIVWSVMEYGSYNCRRTGHSRCITRKEADKARVEYLNLNASRCRYRCLDTDVVNLVGRIYDNNRLDQKKVGRNINCF
jgi:hypothetical protein